LCDKISGEVASEGPVGGPFGTFDEGLRGFLIIVKIAASSDEAFNEEFADATNGNQFVVVVRIYHPGATTYREANVPRV
jgi:hypothetical protein